MRSESQQNWESESINLLAEAITLIYEKQNLETSRQIWADLIKTLTESNEYCSLTNAHFKKQCP